MKYLILVLARCAALRTLFLVTLLFAPIVRSEAATSEWLFAPQPNFPRTALNKATEDDVKLRVVVAKDGTVTGAIISKSAGDPTIDQVAREAVLKWKMNPAAVKPEDLTRGREQSIKVRKATPGFEIRTNTM